MQCLNSSSVLISPPPPTCWVLSLPLPLASMETTLRIQEANLPNPQLGQSSLCMVDLKALPPHLWETVTDGEIREVLPLT